MPLIIIPVSLVVLGILGFAHAVVYESFITIVALLWPGVLTWHIILALRVVFVILAVSFFGMTVVSFYSQSLVTRIAYKMSAIWTGMLMYLFFAGFAYGVLIFGNNIAIDYFHAANHGMLYSKFSFLLFVLAVLVGVYGVIHANKIQIVKKQIKLLNLPASWKGKKAIWVSDIHLGHVRGAAFMEKIVRKIQELKPDIVFIGGDLFDGPPLDEAAAIASLHDLCARTISEATPHVVKDGVYFIMGNHEEFSEKSKAKFLAALQAVPNLRILEDELVTVDGVDLIGVDHGHADNPAKFSVILSRLPIGQTNPDGSQRPSILLKHEPRDLDVAANAGISFQISGHTHNGQVFPATFMARLVFPGFSYGLHERTARNGQKMQVYTSSGVGTWGPPLRVGTRSEIVLFEFE